MKKKTFGVILVPLTVAVLALVLVGGASQARETAPLLPSAPQVQDQVEGYSVYECFPALLAWGEGATPLRTVTLNTSNFGEDEVRVLRLAMMCESAQKYQPGEDGEEVEDSTIFACYYIGNGQYVDDPMVLDTDNFGEDHVFASRSTMLCEQATKEHDGETSGENSYPSNSVWQCFNIVGQPQLDRFSLRTENFGYHNIIAVTGSQLCEDAYKDDDEQGYGEATGNIQECFIIQRLDFDFSFERVTLWTENFGEVHAILGRPSMMCEAAYIEESGDDASIAAPTPPASPTLPPIPTVPPIPTLPPFGGFNLFEGFLP